MHLRDGQKVAYAGDGAFGLSPGDRGVVLSSDSDSAHVMWQSGPHSGRVTLHAVYELVPEGKPARSGLVSEGLAQAVRETMMYRGSLGVIDVLGDEGILTTVADVVDSAVSLVVHSLRSDPVLNEALSMLESDEADAMILATANAMFNEATSMESE